MKPTEEGKRYVESKEFAQALAGIDQASMENDLTQQEALDMLMGYAAVSLCAANGMCTTSDEEVARFINANMGMLAGCIVRARARSLGMTEADFEAMLLGGVQ